MGERIVNLQYTQLDVFGEGIPSEKLFENVIEQLKSEEDMHEFNLLRNEFIHDFCGNFNPECYPYDGENTETKMLLELYSRLSQNYKKQCEIISFDFSLLWQSWAVIKWLQFTIGKATAGDTKQLKDETSKLRQSRNGEISRDSFKIRSMKYYPSLEKYPEYIKAMSVHYLFVERSGLVPMINCDMNQLRIEEQELLNRLVKIAAHRRIDHYSFICDFCNCLATVTSKGTFKSDGSMITPKRMHRSCGSEKCEQDYSAGTTEKSRTQPHAVDENKKRSSEKVTTQWIKVDNTPRWCVGICSKRRLVDKHRICEQCHE